MTQEECWEFFADSMAPFTSPQSVASANRFGCTTMPEDQAKEVIATFFAALATCLSDVETYKVGISPSLLCLS